ncbi:hypothetical protein PGB90_001803 [Kerria lacca]
MLSQSLRVLSVRDQASFCPFALREVSVLAELALGHLRYSLTDVPPQSNSPPGHVLGSDYATSPGLRRAFPSPRLPGLAKSPTCAPSTDATEARSSGVPRKPGDEHPTTAQRTATKKTGRTHIPSYTHFRTARRRLSRLRFCTTRTRAATLLRANPYPEVTDRFCRLPLPTLVYAARGCSPRRPAADIGTNRREDSAWPSPGFSRSAWGSRTPPQRADRLTLGQRLFTRNPSPRQPPRPPLEYLLLPPRSAPTAAPGRLTPFPSARTVAPSYSSGPTGSRGFQLPWPPSCCHQRPTPFMGSEIRVDFGALTRRSVHPAAPVLLTKNGPLGVKGSVVGFAPDPSDDRFARQNRCGPPSGFPLTSSWPGIVHHLSGTNVYTIGAPQLVVDIRPKTRGSRTTDDGLSGRPGNADVRPRCEERDEEDPARSLARSSSMECVRKTTTDQRGFEREREFTRRTTPTPLVVLRTTATTTISATVARPSSTPCFSLYIYILYCNTYIKNTIYHHHHHRRRRLFTFDPACGARELSLSSIIPHSSSFIVGLSSPYPSSSFTRTRALSSFTGAKENITHANKTLCCFVPSRFPLLPCASVVVIKKSSRPSLLLLLFFPLKCSGRNDGQKTDYNDDAGASGVDEDDRARVCVVVATGVAQDSLVTRAAMCVRLVDVRITCGLHDDAQLAAVFIDPRAKFTYGNLVTTFTSSKRPSSVIFPTVQIGSKAAAPRSEDLTAVVQSVVATGGVYKGQGRNQRELMTRAYWEFLVHGEQLQAPIPSTKEVQRVARYKPLGPGINYTLIPSV